MAAVGVLVAICGFLLGRTVGVGESAAPEGSIPTLIGTKSDSAHVPTLGAAKEIPALDLPQPSPEAGEEEAAEPEPEVEPEPVIEKVEPPENPSSSPPGITVAPSE